MKNMIPFSVKCGLTALLLLGVAASSKAEGTSTLTASDGYGATSWNVAGNWSGGMAPGPGTNFFTGGYTLRSPGSGGSVSFLGDSLTLQPLNPYGICLNLKFNSGAFLTMNNCTNASGVIGSGNASTSYGVSGNMVFTAPSGPCAFALAADASRFLVLSNLNMSGSAAISNGYAGNGLGTITYAGNATAFTGPLITSAGTILQAYSQTNLGGNPASFNAAQFLLDNGIFQPLANLTLSNANSGVTISPNGGAFNLGSGITLTISNPIIANGSLTVSNAGTLIVAGSLQAGNAGAAVTNIYGNITISGTNNVAGSGVVGTETINGNLSLNGGTLVYDLNSPSAADRIAFSGAAPTLTQSGTTVITPVSAVANGTYLLITNASGGISIGGTLSLGPIPARGGSASAAFNNTAKSVTMTISSATSTPASLVWRGTNGSSWDASTTNWLNGTFADRFFNADNVTFDDTCSNGTVLLPAGLVPGSVTINSVKTNYAFGGSGLIGGAMTLTKNNGSTLNITNANTFTGGTYIYGGTVVMDNTAALGTGAILDNASLTLNAAGTVANTITGSGAVAQNSPGVVTLSAANSYLGGTTVNQGTLKLGNASALGTPPAGNTLATVASGASLDLGGQNLNNYNSTANYVSVAGSGLSATVGALQTTGGMGCDIGCSVVGLKYLRLAGNASIGDSSGDFQLGTDGNANGGGGVGSIDGQGYTLTKVGNNTIILEATNNTALSQFIISSGGVQWANTANNPVGATCSIVISNNAFIDSWDNNQNSGITLANPFTIGAGGAQLRNDHGPYYGHAFYNTFSGAFALSNNLTLLNTSTYGGAPGNVATSGAFTFSGPISGAGGILINNGGTYTDVYTNATTTNITTSVSTVTLSGPNTYSGPTTVTNGILRITTANQGGGAYTNNDNSVLDVALASATPTMPASSLTLGTTIGCTLSFGRQVAMPAVPVINTTTLTVNGVCTIIPPAFGYADGTYPLIQFTTIGGSGSFALGGSLPRAVTAAIVTNSIFGYNFISLNVTGSGDLWTGQQDGQTWDTNSTANWSTNGIQTVYFDGDVVTFDDTASSIGTIVLPANVAPSSVTFNVTNNSNYVLGQNGSGYNLAGGMALVKNGPGSVVVANTANTFTGGTFINGGTLQLGSSGALNNSSGTVTVTANGALDFNNQQPTKLACTISGAGLNALGTLVQNSGINNDYGPGSITLAGSATIGGNNRWDLRNGANTLNSPSTAYSLTKVGPNLTALVGTTVSPNLGNIYLLGGELGYQLGTTGLGNPTNTLYIGTNATLEFYQASVPLNKNIVCSNGAGLYGENGSGSQNTVVGPVTVLPGANVNFNASGGSLTIATPLWLTNCTINGGGGNPVFAGGISNISGTATFTGSSTIGGPVNIPSGAKLQFNGNYYNTLTFSNVVSGSGQLGLQYQSFINFTASNTFTGNLNVPNCNAGSGTAIRLIGNGSLSQVPLITLQGIASGQAEAGYLIVTNRVDGTLTLSPKQTLQGDNGCQVIGNLTVGAGATLKMASYNSFSSQDTFYVSGSLTNLAGSTNILWLNDDSSPVNVSVNVAGSLVYGGTLVIYTNGVGLMQAGASFQLFPGATNYSGAFSSIVPATPGPGLVWDTSQLAVNGTLGVLSAGGPAVTITSNGGGSYTLTWPGADPSWIVQSNSIDLSNSSDWYLIPGANGGSFTFTVDPTQPQVFYRLANNPSQ